MANQIVGVQTAMFDEQPVYAFVKERQDNTNKRHEAIRARFKELYNGKRLRIDDVVDKLCEEFFLAKITVERILRKG